MAEIQGIDRVFKRVKQIARNVEDARRPLKASGVYMLGSIAKNFKAQGRPKKWKALAPSTLERRTEGDGNGSPQILIDEAILKNSMQVKEVSEGYAVGTADKGKNGKGIRAKRLHYGYPGGKGRGHSRTPARPFVMFQDDDFDAIEKIFTRHVAKK